MTTDVDEDAEFYLNIVGIYKVDTTEVDGDKEITETKYELYGYDNVPYVNENLYTDDLSFSQYNAYEEFDNEENTVSYLHSNNASYVKVNVK